MKRADGRDIKSFQELLKEWQQYFKTLLNNNIITDDLPIEPAAQDLDINTSPFTIIEIKCAIEELKNGKSPGCDYAITPEALKYGGDYVADLIYNICNDV